MTVTAVQLQEPPAQLVPVHDGGKLVLFGVTTAQLARLEIAHFWPGLGVFFWTE